MSSAKFDLDHVDVYTTEPYSKMYGCHPNKCVFLKDGRMMKLLKSDDSNTGVSGRDMAARRSKLNHQSMERQLSRGKVLRDVLLNGAAWEVSTTDMVMKV